MIPFPTDLRLFIHKTIYDFNVHDLLGIVSYYTHDNRVGREQVIKALKIKPNNARLNQNLRYFNKRMGKKYNDKST
tara:strand:- start:11181 stop:11408 length:228 start_codon:yes stop_codon:yes gene_type:complete